jgi:hypothetical protein
MTTAADAAGAISVIGSVVKLRIREVPRRGEGKAENA